MPQNAENLLTQFGATPQKTIPGFKMVAATMTKAVYNRLRTNSQVANISLDPKTVSHGPINALWYYHGSGNTTGPE